jgi:hypothetical protein
MKQKKQPKQRNPYVQHLVKRKSGAHQKPKKVERQNDKVKLRKEWLGQVASNAVSPSHSFLVDTTTESV